jgi:DNA-binding transcriptional regulator YiaG
MEPEDFMFLRRQMGLTQAQLAVELGISRATVTDWERGRTPIKQIAILALRYIAITRPAASRKSPHP